MSNKYNILIVTENYVTPLIFNTSQELYAAWDSIKKNMFGSKEQPKVSYILIDVDKKDKPIEKLVKTYAVEGQIKAKKYDKPILNLLITDWANGISVSTRVEKCLKSEGVYLIGDLIQKTRKDLLGLHNFGINSLLQVKDELKRFDLKLKDDK